MKLFFDLETTGKAEMRMPPTHPRQPHIVQLAALLCDDDGTERASMNVIILQGKPIPPEASAIHGITTEIAERCGMRLKAAVGLFEDMLSRSDTLIAHNLDFDHLVMMAELNRLTPRGEFEACMDIMEYIETFCTMHATTEICCIPGNYGYFKWPKLIEAYRHLFGEDFDGAHDAMADVRACKRIYFEITKPK